MGYFSVYHLVAIDFSSELRPEMRLDHAYIVFGLQISLLAIIKD